MSSVPAWSRSTVFRLVVGVALSAAVAARAADWPTFQQRLGEIAGRVDVFREVWRIDPAAAITGGAARDFVYWVKKAFAKCRGRAACEERVHRELMARGQIAAREFLPLGSDLDVVSRVQFHGLDASKYLLKRVDAVDPERFDSSTALGRSEIDQGFLPAEKILIAKDGVREGGALGEGAREIFEGKLRVHFTERAVFEATHYAKIGVNHPFLLAMRWVKLLSMHDRTEFPDQPRGDLERVLKGGDAEDFRTVRRIFAETAGDATFAARLKIPKFLEFANQTVRKAFGARTNPASTRALLLALGAPAVWLEAGTALESFNHFLYARKSDRAFTLARLRELDVADPERLLVDAHALTGGVLYHGTETETAFQSILLHGAYPSDAARKVGSGLYAVDRGHLDVATKYAGNSDRIVEIPLAKEAVVIDQASPLYETVRRRLGARGLPADFDAVAEWLGADAYYYVLGDARAFAVKNSAVLGKPKGHTRDVLTFDELVEWARKSPVGSDRSRFLAAACAMPTELSQFDRVIGMAGLPESWSARLAAVDAGMARAGHSSEARFAARRAMLGFWNLLDSAQVDEAGIQDAFRPFESAIAFMEENRVSPEVLRAALTVPPSLVLKGDSAAFVRLARFAIDGAKAWRKKRNSSRFELWRLRGILGIIAGFTLYGAVDAVVTGAPDSTSFVILGGITAGFGALVHSLFSMRAIPLLRTANRHYAYHRELETELEELRRIACSNALHPEK